MLLSLVMLVSGIYALINNEFRITDKRKVKGSINIPLGISLIIGALLSGIPGYGPIIQLIILIVVIIVGLNKSERITETIIEPQSIENKN